MHWVHTRFSTACGSFLHSPGCRSIWSLSETCDVSSHGAQTHLIPLSLNETYSCADGEVISAEELVRDSTDKQYDNSKKSRRILKSKLLAIVILKLY